MSLQCDLPEDRRLNMQPSVLGYWAARHGLSLRDLMTAKFAGHLPLYAASDREAFERGFHRYEAERHAERLKALFDDLEKAYDPDQPAIRRHDLEKP